MSAYYQTLLTLNFVVFALALGGIGAIHQVVSGAAGTRVPRLALVGRRVSIFVGLSILNFGICLVGSVLLATDHDLLPGLDLQTDKVLASPVTGVVVGGLTLFTVVVAVFAVIRAATALSPAGSAVIITRSWQPMAGKHDLDADLGALADLARKALVDGRDREYGRVLGTVDSALVRAGALGDEHVLEVATGLEEHFVPLAQESVLTGRPLRAADVAALAGKLAAHAPGRLGLLPFLRIEVLVGDLLFDRRSATALARVMADIRNIGELALAESDGNASLVFDEACRSMGAIGERTPATFLDPGDPEVLMTPGVVGVEGPMGKLVEGWVALFNAAYPLGASAPLVDLLVWRDGLMRSTQALVIRIDERFQDDRLEAPLIQLAGTLAHAGIRAAGDDQWKTVSIVIPALGALAEHSSDDFYLEYPNELASWLMQIGMCAEEDNAAVAGVGVLAEIAANHLATHLAAYCQRQAMELNGAGTMSPVSPDARTAFIKRLGTKLGSSPGLDP